MKVCVNSKGQKYYVADTPPSTHKSLMSFVTTHPSTMTKLVNVIAQALTIRDPLHLPVSAKNAMRLSNDTKKLLSVYEVVALGTKSFDHLLRAFLPSEEHHPFTNRSDFDTVPENAIRGVSLGMLSIGKALASYAYMMKAGIVFVGAAADITKAKLQSEMTLGLGAVIGTFSDMITLWESVEAVMLWHGDLAENGLKFTGGDDLLEIQKARVIHQLFSAASDFLKTISYVGLGTLALLAAISPAILIPWEAVYLLTVSTIVWTVTKHFAEEEVRKLDCNVEEIFIKNDSLNPKRLHQYTNTVYDTTGFMKTDADTLAADYVNAYTMDWLIPMPSDSDSDIF